MSFGRDRQIRHYCEFLIAFVLLLFFSGMWAYSQQASIVRDLFLEHDRAVVTSLLEQGISEDVIARAITNTSGTEVGTELLTRIGITSHTAIKFFPFITDLQQQTGLFMMIAWVVLTGMLFTGTFLFFRKREQLYRQATQVILHFIQGDFSHHLTQANEGAIFQFFASVDQLATILQSKNDTQEKAKEFLKNTISDISHQLKTPLTALSMYHEIISDEPENVETVREYSEKTGLAINRMDISVHAENNPA